MMQIDKYKIHMDGTISNVKTGKVIKPQDNGRGYKKVTLTINGVQIQKYVHRLVADAYCKKPETTEKLQVNHKDGDKSNNNYLNLEWVTNSENQIHAHKTGLKPNGKDLWNGKFDTYQIKLMNRMDQSGVKRYEIAEKFGCSKSTISDILNGKRYKYHALTCQELTIKEPKKCKYVKREGESCTLNDNCTYPNCKE